MFPVGTLLPQNVSSLLDSQELLWLSAYKDILNQCDILNQIQPILTRENAQFQPKFFSGLLVCLKDRYAFSHYLNI